jgi:ADP-heptose:LPS heptosyltransferase
VRHVPLTYTRADTLYYRLAAGRRLHSLIPSEDSIVVDPDSRLTQLGLLPVCPEEFYYFFESRAYGHESDRGLTGLTAQWLAETFDIEEAKPYVAPAQEIDTGDRAVTAVSLGVGENQSKRIPDPFERDLIGGLVGNDGVVLVDRGAGGEESARVARAVAESGARADQVMLWDGSFAAFASAISRSRMYVGYDSAGQHVAAACGTPLVVVFTGFASERMFHRWRPSGEGQVIRVDTPDPAKVLVDTLSAVYRLT